MWSLFVKRKILHEAQFFYAIKASNHKKKCICEAQMPLLRPFCFWKLWPWYLTLTDDLDLGTKKTHLNDIGVRLLIMDRRNENSSSVWGLTKRNIHVKYESSISYHSKVTANIKVFCGQMDKQTEQKLFAPDLSMWRHSKFKNCFFFWSLPPL